MRRAPPVPPQLGRPPDDGHCGHRPRGAPASATGRQCPPPTAGARGAARRRPRPRSRCVAPGRPTAAATVPSGGAPNSLRGGGRSGGRGLPPHSPWVGLSAPLRNPLPRRRPTRRPRPPGALCPTPPRPPDSYAGISTRATPRPRARAVIRVVVVVLCSRAWPPLRYTEKCAGLEGGAAARRGGGTPPPLRGARRRPPRPAAPPMGGRARLSRRGHLALPPPRRPVVAAVCRGVVVEAPPPLVARGGGGRSFWRRRPAGGCFGVGGGGGSVGPPG